MQNKGPGLQWLSQANGGSLVVSWTAPVASQGNQRHQRNDRRLVDLANQGLSMPRRDRGAWPAHGQCRTHEPRRRL
ncbi:hypothetical protein CEP53_011680 [Fusarium sp. AF-6]|nr:hypothetical protein CEP53_011680 [Fusarium sp. AF-6]